MKKINYKKIFVAVLWSIAIVSLSTSLAFVSKSEGDIVANSLNITIYNNEENQFLSQADITKYLAERNDQILSKKFSSINIPEIEKALNAHHAIESAEVATNINGEVKIDVVQRTPVLRVINKNGESYYIDSQNKLMPLNENYSARVLVASGEINEPFSRRYQYSVEQISKHKMFSELSLLDDILEVATCINSDSVLSALIHQIYVNKEKEIELFPAIGNHKILFGEAKDVVEKLNRLKLFYTEGLNKSDGWNKYTAINLKYKNLVVCTRK